MEERIIGYEDFSQVQEIISNLASENFLLVEHKTQTKQLFFKKPSIPLESIIIGEP
ncbi:MAG: hypothetical protein WC821_03675 [archaeon]|jgi:hypothetical protein